METLFLWARSTHLAVLSFLVSAASIDAASASSSIRFFSILCRGHNTARILGRFLVFGGLVFKAGFRKFY